jgi:hypothetical protein
MATSSLKIAIKSATKANRKFSWGEQVEGFKIYACSDPQLEVLSSRARFTFVFAGTGGGKTCMIPLWLIKQLERHQKNKPGEFWRAMVVSPTSDSFKKSQLKYHIESVFDGTPIRLEWKTQDKTFKFNGGEIVVVTAENDYKRLSGGQYDAIVLDECWQMTEPEIWAEARRRSNIKMAPILGVTTPNTDGWLYPEIYLNWQNGDSDYKVVQWNTNVNPAKTAEEHAKYLESERLKMAPARFERMFGGQFSQLTGLIYQAFGNDKPDNKDPVSYPVIKTTATLPSPAVKVFGSIDYGWNDPTVAHIYVHCEDDNVYIVDELYESNMQIDDVVIKIKALQDKWSTNLSTKYGDNLKGGTFEAFWTDNSRPEVGQMLRRAGVTIRNHTIKMIEGGISVTDSVFRCNRVKVFDCCKNLIREAKGYTWKSDNTPKAGNDHAMDSMRYGLSSYFNGKVINPNFTMYSLTENERTRHQLDVAKRLNLAKSQEELDLERMKATEAKQMAWMQKMMTMDEPD